MVFAPQQADAAFLNRRFDSADGTFRIRKRLQENAVSAKLTTCN
jgi:hypothetical protein